MKEDLNTVFDLKEHDTIVVGCSAGPDSMALLDMLLRLKEKKKLLIICAHVNHNVRKESVEEEKYIRNYCKEKKIMYETMTIEHYGDDNFHNEARNIRYHFFEGLVAKYNANYLMTAHHGDDLVETILMRITRGSNLGGYSGFKKIVDMGDYKIVRPLINFTKKQLEDYDLKNNIKYFIDGSNSKDKYTRNRYRKYLLPFLKEEDANVHLKFLKFSNNLEEASHYIEKERDKALELVYRDGVIDVLKFLDIDLFLQKEVLYYLLHDFYQDDLILVGDRHIDLLLKMIHGSKANVTINLPNEVVAIRSYNSFYLNKITDEIMTYEIEFNKYVTLPFGHVIELVDDSSENNNNICRLNSENIVLPLIIRTRKIGDRMAVKGLNGTQKVKDIFIDKKINPDKRAGWPIVVDSRGEVVWLPGLKKSKFDKKKSEKYDIILKYR